MSWIKLHRRFLQWEWYDEPNTVRLFIHILLKANFEQKEWHGITIYPGQLVTGRKILSKELNLSERKIRTSIERLKSTNELTIKTTSNFSIITICKWGSYQTTESVERPTKRPAKEPTNDQQTTTTKEYMKDKNYISTIFENFREEYPGTKRGLETEFENFLKKNNPEIAELLLPALQKEINYKNQLQKSGEFCAPWKNLSTWINKKCWEQEFEPINREPKSTYTPPKGLQQ